MKKFRDNEFKEARIEVQKRSLKNFAASPNC